MPSFNELERAALNVITILKTLPDYGTTRIAIFGGLVSREPRGHSIAGGLVTKSLHTGLNPSHLALWKYLPMGRTTEDVDFYVTIDGAPQSVKQRLLALPNSPFVQQADYFFYKMPNGSLIQIDFTASWQSPYEAAAAKKLQDLSPGQLPYISPIDLVVFKINSCGLRASPAKRRTDALDAQGLLAQLALQGPVHLTTAQKNFVMQGLDDVVNYGTNNKTWWKEKLGL